MLFSASFDPSFAAVQERRPTPPTTPVSYPPYDTENRLLRHEQFVGTWDPVTLDVLAAELAPAGLVADPFRTGVALIGHRRHGVRS